MGASRWVSAVAGGVFLAGISVTPIAAQDIAAQDVAARDIAAQDRGGVYVALRLIGGVSSVDDVGENAAGALDIRHDDDFVAAVAGAIGYDWSGFGFALRTEIEYHHRFRFDFDTRILSSPAVGYENNLRTDTVLVNAVYDFDIGTGVRPYLGAGGGWVRNTSEVDRTVLTGGLEERADGKDSFAWSLLAGLRYAVSARWQVELAYRYIDLGEVESGPFSDGTVIKAQDYTSHDVLIGVAYRF